MKREEAAQCRVYRVRGDLLIIQKTQVCHLLTINQY